MPECEKQIEIYQGESGEVVFGVEGETIWATQDQMAQIFAVDRTVISRHLRNIYQSGELVEAATSAKNAQVRLEGGREVLREVKKYNLDAIISVGYRVNSQKATKFRIWATGVLKQYVVGGIAVNERRLGELDAKKLKEIEGMVGVVRRLMRRQLLDSGEASGILEVISSYMNSFRALKEYEDGRIDLSSVNLAGGKERKLTVEMCEKMINELAKHGEGQFEQRKNGAIEAILSELYSAHKNVAERAANLLYRVVKEQPFTDGNKRIGAMLFIVFLTMNDYHLTRSGETKISDRALTALTLLMAESEEAEKELIIALTCKLLEE